MRWMATLAVFYALAAGAQNERDPLLRIWKDTSEPDTARIRALSSVLDLPFVTAFPDSTYELGGQLHALANQHGDRLNMAVGLTAQGLAEYTRSAHDRALALHARAYTLYRELGDKTRMAATLSNMGNSYYAQGLPDSTIALEQRALLLRQELDDRRGVAVSLFSIANVKKDRGQYVQALEDYERARDEFDAIGAKRELAATLNNIGTVYMKIGKRDAAIAHLLQALKIKEAIGDDRGAATSLNNISLLHLDAKDYEQMLEYNRRALGLFKKVGNRDGYARTLDYMGIAERKLGRLDSALLHTEQARAILDSTGHRMGLAQSLNNLAQIREDMGDVRRAIELCEESLLVFRELGDPALAANALGDLAEIHAKHGHLGKAIDLGNQGLALARSVNAAAELKGCALILYDAYKRSGDMRNALAMHELYMATRDSVLNLENERKLVSEEARYELDKRVLADSLRFAGEQAVKEVLITEQQASITRQRIGLFLALGILGVITTLAFGIHRARRRSEHLLLNILPSEVAEELKDTGAAAAKHFESATILFSDFKGFTMVSEQLSPQELVEELNVCFKAFDHITAARGIEKIKTIGDAYMCAGGLPDPKSSSPADVVHAALEMQAFMKGRKAERDAQGLPAFEMRVGIHTGPVVAGIVGVKKFQYDIWGDTVNTASRMESSGEVGQVNISEATYALVKNATDLKFTPRGKVKAKGKGELEMYFVERGPKP